VVVVDKIVTEREVLVLVTLVVLVILLVAVVEVLPDNITEIH
jgi:hypothetical protein